MFCPLFLLYEFYLDDIDSAKVFSFHPVRLYWVPRVKNLYIKEQKKYLGILNLIKKRKKTFELLNKLN